MLAGRSMTEPDLPRHDYRPSGRHLFESIVFGHLAGASVFIVALIVFGQVSKQGLGSFVVLPSSNPTKWLEGLGFLLGLTGGFALVTAFCMVPLTVLVLPIVLLAAYKLRAGLLVTMALGAETGLLPAILLLHRSTPQQIYPYAAAAVAGAAFASVIWAQCIRPRLRAPDGTA